MAKQPESLYELPCYPNKAPQHGSRLIVSIQDNFCGGDGSTLFIGGCGYGEFSDYEAARRAIVRTVLEELTRRRDEAEKRLTYAQRLLTAWDSNPEMFRSRGEL